MKLIHYMCCVILLAAPAAFASQCSYDKGDERTYQDMTGKDNKAVEGSEEDNQGLSITTDQLLIGITLRQMIQQAINDVGCLIVVFAVARYYCYYFSN